MSVALSSLMLFAAIPNIAELPPVQRQRMMDRIIRGAARSAFKAVAQVDFEIDPDGYVIKCSLSYSEGDDRVTDRICRAMERARFTPATGPDGQRVHSRSHAVIEVGNPRPSHRAPPDHVLEVDNLPNGLQETERAVIVYANEAGTIVNCVTDDALSDAACGWIKTHPLERMLDKGNAGVDFVTRVTVRFIVVSSPS